MPAKLKLNTAILELIDFVSTAPLPWPTFPPALSVSGGCDAPPAGDYNPRGSARVTVTDQLDGAAVKFN